MARRRNRETGEVQEMRGGRWVSVVPAKAGLLDLTVPYRLPAGEAELSPDPRLIEGFNSDGALDAILRPEFRKGSRDLASAPENPPPARRVPPGIINPLASLTLDQLRNWEARRRMQDEMPPPQPAAKDDYVAQTEPLALASGEPKLMLSDGKTKMAGRDPALVEGHRRISYLLTSGASDAAVREAGRKHKIDPEKGIKFRRDRRSWTAWRRQHPDQIYPMNYNDVPVETEGLERVRATAANSPIGAYVVSVGQKVTGNRLDDIGGTFGHDRERLSQGVDLLRIEHPISSYAGDVSGDMLLTYGPQTALGAAARKSAVMVPWLLTPGRKAAKVIGPHVPAPIANILSPRKIATDAIYGAYSGSEENEGDRWAGAMDGALRNVMIGAAVRAGSELARGVDEIAYGGLIESPPPPGLPAQVMADFEEAKIANAADRVADVIYPTPDPKLMPGSRQSVQPARQESAEEQMDRLLYDLQRGRPLFGPRLEYPLVPGRR